MDVHPTRNVSIGIDPYPYIQTTKQNIFPMIFPGLRHGNPTLFTTKRRNSDAIDLGDAPPVPMLPKLPTVKPRDNWERWEMFHHVFGGFLQCGAPKRYKLVNITPSNYGYNYHKP